MLKYKLVSENDSSVTYHYFPEERTDNGAITVEKKTGKVLDAVIAKTDKFKRYYYHMISEIKEFAKTGDFRKEGIVAWY